MHTPTIVAVLLVYLAMMLVIGIWSSRESGDMAGYYVAGKRLPSWVIAFSSNATGESGWLLLGLTGMGYAVGVHAFWVVMGEVLGVALAWVLVARPFKEYTDRYDSITVPDYLEARFKDKRHVLRICGVLIILSMVAAYTAAQLTASGKAFNSFLGISYPAGVLLGAAVVLFYTSVGGFKAVAYTDFVQGLFMLICLVALPIAGILDAGGWSAMLSNLNAQDPKLLLPMGSFGNSVGGLASVLGFLGIGLAFLGSPQLLTRFMSARDQKQIVNGSLYAVLCIIGFDVGAVLAGMAGRSMFPGLADSETILPTMGADLFPPIFVGILLVVVLAAIMSTVDSLLILASSAVVRDIVQKVWDPGWSDQRLSLIGKLTTVVLGGIAVVLALSQTRMIFWFVLFAWSGLACAFTPVILCSLFWKRTTLSGAVTGMLGGFVTTVTWVLFFKSRYYDLYEMLPGFAVGMALTIGVSLLTDPPEGADQEFDSVKHRVGHPFRAAKGRPRVTRIGEEPPTSVPTTI